MALDLVALRALVDQLETETAEAVAAKGEMETATAAATAAQLIATAAVESYVVENDERLAKMTEMITALQAALAEG